MIDVLPGSWWPLLTEPYLMLNHKCDFSILKIRVRFIQVQKGAKV